MAAMTHIERMRAVLSGELPDHAPVSFWHHFAPECQQGTRAVDAHLRFLERFDLDFLKAMNDNGYPQCPDIRSAADLRDLPVFEGDEEEFARQLALIRALSSELSGVVHLATTLFNAWTLLRRIVVPRTSNRHNPPTLGGPPASPELRLTELIAEDRSAVGRALDAIATSQANFARKCIEAGADGVFLSVRDDWVDTEAHGPGTYDQLVRPGDLRILDAAQDGRFNMLHVCGVPRNFDAFANYPVQIINWADRATGPAIGDVIGCVTPVVCGGVDNLSTLPHGTPSDVEEEARDALRQAGNRPMIVSAGCTYDPDTVPEENLNAMVRAARSA